MDLSVRKSQSCGGKNWVQQTATEGKFEKTGEDKIDPKINIFSHNQINPKEPQLLQIQLTQWLSCGYVAPKKPDSLSNLVLRNIPGPLIIETTLLNFLGLCHVFLKRCLNWDDSRQQLICGQKYGTFVEHFFPRVKRVLRKKRWKSHTPGEFSWHLQVSSK